MHCMLQVLAKANILSAPLVVENGLEDSGSPTFRESGSSGQAVIGWIDVADLVAALLSRERAGLCQSICACRALSCFASHKHLETGQCGLLDRELRPTARLKP